MTPEEILFKNARQFSAPTTYYEKHQREEVIKAMKEYSSQQNADLKKELEELKARLIPSTKEDTVNGTYGSYPEFQKFSVYSPSQHTIATDHTTRKEDTVKPDFEKLGPRTDNTTVGELIEFINGCEKIWNDYYLPLQKENEKLKQQILSLQTQLAEQAKELYDLKDKYGLQ